MSKELPKELERRIRAEKRRTKELASTLKQILENCYLFPQKEMTSFEQVQNWSDFLDSARELVKETKN